jgi:hypothetical protein
LKKYSHISERLFSTHAARTEGKFMYQRNTTPKKSTFKSLIAITAFACTIFAGSLTAEVVRSEQVKRGIDPLILSIVDGFESGKLITAKEYTSPRTLKPRAKDRKERVSITDRSRLMVKFADELKVRVASNGELVSRTNKSIDTVIDAALALGVTISPAAEVEEAKVNDLIARAEARSGKQMPDIGGMFWIDGPLTSVKAAADVFYIMPEVEWLNAPKIHLSDSPYRGEKLSNKTGRAFNHPSKNTSARRSTKMNGACMFRAGMCQESVSPETCEDLGGTFLGRGSVCKSNSNENANRGGGACCTLGGCIDTNFANCMTANGIWYGAEGDACADIEGECPPDTIAYMECGTFDDLGTYFTGDCYIDQTVQVELNRPQFAPGCLDVGYAFPDWDGFPNPQEGFIDIEQLCCIDVSAIVPHCGTDAWDHVCASYANANIYCFNLRESCGSPFGPDQGLRRQPKVDLDSTGCPDGFEPNCWPFDPAIDFFTPEAITPDFFKMGLQAWATGDPISYTDWGLSSTNALPQLLPYPMGGGVIGDVSYLMNDWLPSLGTLLSGDGMSEDGVTTDDAVIGGIAQTMWGGEGLDLHITDPDADPGGMHGYERYTGLYGLGNYHVDFIDPTQTNGTYGAGVKVAVLDYAADIKNYTNNHGSFGSVHEELINVTLEGPDTGHTEVRMYFDPVAEFQYSRHHGNAILGIMAADWDPDDPDSNVGIMGIAPQAEYSFFPLVGAIEDDKGVWHGQGRAATAWINAMLTLGPGDVLAATYNPQGGQGGGLNNLDYNAFSHDQITIATALGISVVIGAGMASADLAAATTPSGTDSGAIVAGAVSPGSPFKRYANGNRSSNYVLGDGGNYGETYFSKVTASAWGAGVTTCGFGPTPPDPSWIGNWLGYQTINYGDCSDYNLVASRSYTNNFTGTSAASAIIAGCVIAMQGFALQVFETPLSPMFTRLYIGGGSYGGMTPSDPDDPAQGGDPIMNYPNTYGLSSENSMNGGGLTWDFVGVEPGTGNLVGNLVDPRQSCEDAFVDPIFETPGIEDIMIITGEHDLGNSGSIAAKDSMYFSLIPQEITVGEHPVPDDYTGPGDTVTYLSTATVSDIYLSGLLRGGLAPGNIMNWDVVMLDSTYTSTILLLYMWDFSRNTWVQAATSELLTAADVNDEGKIEVNFLVQRASRMIDRTGVYHARFVTITQPEGDGNFYPYFYDQIRVRSGNFPGIPQTMP